MCPSAAGTISTSEWCCYPGAVVVKRSRDGVETFFGFLEKSRSPLHEHRLPREAVWSWNICCTVRLLAWQRATSIFSTG
ncbi:hypothetical protein DPMN_009957 [Dreissena polymorpha]|uniref:Uncharacterized protein n=1 Tax=Dreissena polymorpha TaxID=45954 RepID=A0A9D4S0I4_DREPO|nr:hypothetical protein DPMN_009957 [Dreissena polymorpha]